MASTADIWPSAPVVVSNEVKQTILRFFEISNSTDITSGRLFAEELFTKDGIFTTHKTLFFKGHDKIAASRKNNSPLIKSRACKLVRIYSSNSPATDLVVLGRFDITLQDGNCVSMDFTARFVVSSGFGENGKLKYVQVWTDNTEMQEAYQKAEQTLASRPSSDTA